MKKVIGGGSADKAGLHVGDHILEINGQVIAGMSYNDTLNIVKQSQLVNIKVKRGIVPVNASAAETTSEKTTNVTPAAVPVPIPVPAPILAPVKAVSPTTAVGHTFKVSLLKGEAGLGIKFRAEFDPSSNELNVSVQKILPDSPASQNGTLKENDRVIEMNSMSLVQVTKPEGIKILQSANGMTDFLVWREGKAAEPIVEEPKPVIAAVAIKQDISNRDSTASFDLPSSPPPAPTSELPSLSQLIMSTPTVLPPVAADPIEKKDNDRASSPSLSEGSIGFQLDDDEDAPPPPPPMSAPPAIDLRFSFSNGSNADSGMNGSSNIAAQKALSSATSYNDYLMQQSGEQTLVTITADMHNRYEHLLASVEEAVRDGVPQVEFQELGSEKYNVGDNIHFIIIFLDLHFHIV